MLVAVCCAGVIPPDASVWPDPGAATILRIKKAAGMELTDADGNVLETQWMHLHFDGDTAGRTVTLTVEVSNAEVRLGPESNCHHGGTCLTSMEKRYSCSNPLS